MSNQTHRSRSKSAKPKSRRGNGKHASGLNRSKNKRAAAIRECLRSAEACALFVARIAEELGGRDLLEAALARQLDMLLEDAEDVALWVRYAQGLLAGAATT